MRGEATAVAHANIALAKYWGKRPGPGNYPAVPSLSVTLAGLRTVTTVRFVDEGTGHRLVLDGKEELGPGATKAAALLDRVKAHAGIQGFAHVESRNEFPTAAGLASSASGFAAMAAAACAAAGITPGQPWISDLARRASASAARSLFGGFVELDAGPANAGDGEALLAARPLAPAEHLPLVILVCVTRRGPKDTASTEGMTLTARESPFYVAWVEEAPRLFTRMKDALAAKDLPTLGALAERSALAMHASAMAAGVVYLNGTSLEVLRRVQRLRHEGLSTFATMDAGPHVKVMVSLAEEQPVATALASVPGVLEVRRTVPGPAVTVTMGGAP